MGLTLAFRWLGSGTQFLLNVVLGRLMGAEGLGIYYLFYSWARLLSQAGGFGIPPYALRTVSVLESEGSYRTVDRFMKASLGLVTLSGLMISVFVFAFAPQLAQAFLGSSELAYLLRFAAVAGTLFMIIRLFAEILKALGKAEVALTIEFSFYPIGLLLFIGIGTLLAMPISATHAVLGTIIVLAIAILVAYVVFHRYQRARLASSGPESGRVLFQAQSMLTFWTLGILTSTLANLPFILLPQFATPAEIGEFGVAYRLVALAATILAALGSRFSPGFARHYVNRDAKALARDLRASQIYSFLAYAPLLLLFAFFADSLLAIFGPEFQSARLALYIMAVGQAINSATGLTGQFLNMTNQERLASWISAFSLLLMVVLIMLLGPMYGVIGVASAYSLVVALQNLASFVATTATIRRLREAR